MPRYNRVSDITNIKNNYSIEDLAKRIDSYVPIMEEATNKVEMDFAVGRILKSVHMVNYTAENYQYIRDTIERFASTMLNKDYKITHVNGLHRPLTWEENEKLFNE